MLGQPSRTRSIVYLVMGILIVVIEAAVLAIFAAAGDVARQPLARGLFPAAILFYGLYLTITSARKLRGAGK